MTTEELKTVVDQHKLWLEKDGGMRADLRWANLSGANLRWASLSRAVLCGATIDGAILADNALGGPGHILCALTDAEWASIKTGREKTA